MPRPEPLPVWLDGMEVAVLTSSKPWSLKCRYAERALEVAPTGSPLISCSLPLGTGLPDASVFCSGLLPEGQHRHAMAALAGVAANDTYGLLKRFGRDVAGALIIGDHDDTRESSVEAYTTQTLESEISELPDRPLGLHDDSELSIAGIQNKLLLVRLDDGGWGRPVHGAPSTHILKLDDPRHPGLVEAEASCLRLAHALGLTTIEPELVTIAEQRCLIVNRFDRTIDTDGLIRRIHQEDICQALARDPEANQGRGKYERFGGPALVDVAGLLESWAHDPLDELRQLLGVTTFNVAVGNADAHGKNLGLLHPDPRSVTLAPLYDVVPTVLWPKLRTKAAMSVGAKDNIDAITAQDLTAEARRWRLPAAQAETVVSTTLEQLRQAAAGNPDIIPAVKDLVLARTEKMSK